jgi:hypothetical protein
MFGRQQRLILLVEKDQQVLKALSNEIGPNQEFI